MKALLRQCFFISIITEDFALKRTTNYALPNSTPFVRQYDILSNKWGCFAMPKGVPNKRYTPEFKKLVIATMQEEKLSYSETCRRFEINSRDRIKSWERIYLEEGPEGFAVERRGRSSKGRPPKRLPKEVTEDLLAEVQRLRAEVDYLKKFASLGFGRRATPAQKTLVVQKLRQKHALSILLSIAQLPRATFYYHLKQMQKDDKYVSVKPSSGLDKRKYRRQQAEKSATLKGRRECADLTI